MSNLFFATCAKNMEGLLLAELQALGAIQVKETVAGVYFQGEIELGYRTCLWSRLANQILVQVAQFTATTDAQLYQGIHAIDWAEHLDADGTFYIDVSGHSPFANPLFLAQRVKDAIADQFRERTGKRPSIAAEEPDVCLNIHVHQNTFTVNISLSGESLHRRGYRLDAGPAPLKETLAAAILLRAKWPMQQPPVLLDPFCGTGTLLIEAALMAFDIAPGLYRRYFGFNGWQQHRPAIWNRLKAEAETRRQQGLLRQEVNIVGSDIHPEAIRKAKENSHRAGLSERIQLQCLDCKKISPPAATGLMIANPPYGERMNTDDLAGIKQLFLAFGKHLKHTFQGWRLAIFSGAPQDVVKALEIRAKQYYPLFNGTLACRLYLFDIQADRFMLQETSAQKQARLIQNTLTKGLSPQAEMFANRLRKNSKNLASWSKREHISAYRLYDADLPDYAIAVDFYEGQWLHVQEYQAPKDIDPLVAEHRLQEAIAVLHRELSIPPSRIFVKVRAPQKGKQQYERLQETEQFFNIHEGPATYAVNFTDYLDTGVFLDHQIVRQKFATASHGKTVLNLFAYTCTASVQALLAGAKQATNVDLSNTYLDWGKRNYRLNQLPLHPHDFIQADCLEWLKNNREQYDLIFLNPPTFSNSKRMENTWDVARDHVALIQLAMSHLKRGGTLWFSCNLRNFKLNQTALSAYKIIELSHATLRPDFHRRANMHHVFLLQP